jgi:hypothetical protein
MRTPQNRLDIHYSFDPEIRNSCGLAPLPVILNVEISNLSSGEFGGDKAAGDAARCAFAHFPVFERAIRHAKAPGSIGARELARVAPTANKISEFKFGHGFHSPVGIGTHGAGAGMCIGCT